MAEQASSKTTAKVVALAVAGALGGFLFGFDSSVVNGAVDAVQKNFGLSAGLISSGKPGPHREANRYPALLDRIAAEIPRVQA